MSGEQFIQDGSQREDVCSLVYIFRASNLFWSHIRRRTHLLTGARLTFLGEIFPQSEVTDFWNHLVACALHHHVCRLQVAMNNSTLVCFLDRI